MNVNVGHLDNTSKKETRQHRSRQQVESSPCAHLACVSMCENVLVVQQPSNIKGN